MKLLNKPFVLSLFLLSVVAIHAQSNKPKPTPTPASAGVDTGITSDGAIVFGEITYSNALTIPPAPKFFAYRPQKDITAYELAVLTPYLGPRIWGRDASRKAVVVPTRVSVPCAEVGGTILELSAYDVEQLTEEGAMRHLLEVSCNQR